MMTDNRIKPLITVIVPVYNGELWLNKCLDSLVYQTLENIEIIAVNNGSTDGTGRILESYAARFPEKFFCGTIEHTNGPGGGRNYGLAHARADYIIFADADDYFDYHAMKILYDKALSGDYDMVCCASYDVRGGSMKKTRELQSTDKAYVLQHGSMVFWNKLVKKKLFDQAGPVPEHIVFEDIAYVSTLISYAERIGYVDLPLYYYIIRDDSGVNDLRSDRLLHCLEAYKIAIEHCKSDMRQELVASIAHRVCYDLRAARWTFADKYIEYIKENEELFDIPQVKKDTRTYQQLERIYQLGSGTIPQKVYLNAFHGKSPRNRQEIQDYAFYKTTEVLCLDESNCDVGKLPVIQQAYENGDDEFVAQYFALEKIYESGGVYLSDCIEIINTFNCLKYCEAFVGYLDDTTFTDKVFGGKAGSKLVEGLLKTYRFGGLYEKPEYTLADRMRNLFVVKYKLSPDGKTRILKDHTCILEPQVLVTDVDGDFHICRHQFREQAGKEEYLTIKKSTLEYLLKNRKK